MSVLIPGMEMPQTGVYEIAVDNTWGKDKTVMSLYTRKENGMLYVFGSFEIVPVPPHGRLIDADALIELIGFEVRHYVVKDEFDKGRVAAWNNVIRAIREYVPTIIPAEEGEG